MWWRVAVILVVATLVPSSYAGKGADDLDDFEEFTGRMLKKYCGKDQKKIKTAADCVKKCIGSKSCLSVNYNTQGQKCSLCTRTKYNAGKHFKTAKGWNHFVQISKQSSHCPAGSLLDSSNDRCYILSKSKLNWGKANSLCKKQGGWLLTVANKETSDTIGQLFKGKSAVQSDFWIGLKQSGKSYKWNVGRTKFTLKDTQFWKAGFGGTVKGKTCVKAKGANGVDWEPAKCGDKLKFVCEIRQPGDRDINTACPAGWSLYGGACYKFVDNKDGFDGARENCKAFGADLVKLRNGKEKDFLLKKAAQAFKKESFWLGLTTGGGKEWKWVEGGSTKGYAKRSKFINAITGKGSAKAQMCGAAKDSGGFAAKCSNQYRYICKSVPGEVQSFACRQGQLKCGEGMNCQDKGSRSKCKCKPGFKPKKGKGKKAQQTCVKKTATSSICQASGDPHYRTFDGKMLHFQGTCRYVLAKPCDPQTDNLADFSVEEENENRPGRNPRAAFVKTVIVRVYNHTFRLKKDNSFWLDGEKINLDFEPTADNFPDLVDKVSASALGTKGAKIETDFGLVVTYSSSNKASVSLMEEYKTKMCGICGNWNGQQDDDLFPKDATSKGTYAEVGNSWIVPMDETDVPEGQKCVSSTQDDEIDCAEKETYRTLCQSKLTIAPFLSCNGDATEGHIENCVTDMCAFDGKDESLCMSLQAYADSCESPVEWRSEVPQCAEQCPANSEYTAAASACPASCTNPEGALECLEEEQPGCQCMDEFLLSAGKCVPADKCGCTTPDGTYYQAGEKRLSKDCRTEYTCEADGSISERGLPKCASGSKCRVDKDGTRKCKCKAGEEMKGGKCTDINECTAGTDKCPASSTCKNTKGSYKCDCNKGFAKKNYVCVDIDECKAKKSPCKGKCENTVGSYKCVCEEGYEIQARGKQCKNIDECKTKKHNCPANSKCKDTRGKYTCRCGKGLQRIETAEAALGFKCAGAQECLASGDPHFTTLDQLKFDFQGGCQYTLSQLCPANVGGLLAYYNVEIKNKPSSSKRVSTVYYMDIDVYGYRIRFAQKRAVYVKKAGEKGIGLKRNLPIGGNGNSIALDGAPELEIKLVGRYLQLRTGFGLVVQYDGSNKARVSVSDSYMGKVCGICGNYNGNKLDDLRDRNGVAQTGQTVTFTRKGKTKTKLLYTKIGESWEVAGDGSQPGCQESSEPTGICDPAVEDTLLAKDTCGMITDTAGPFGACQAKIPDAEVTQDECVFDACLDDKANQQKRICDALEKFAEQCGEEGVAVGETWRGTNCQITCGANMEFRGNGTACPATCLKPDQDEDDCPYANVDGCFCKAGFVRSGDTCVTKDKCGCTYGGMYLAVGETEVSADCSKQHKCEASGKITTSDAPACGQNAECLIKDGERGCFCIPGFRGDNINGCNDVDECIAGTNDCSPNAECTNAVGSFSCDCRSGFDGDGKLCTKLSTCASGFERLPGANTCTDINECLKNPCGTGATCSNIPGDYECACLRGMVGDAAKGCFSYAYCSATGDPHYKTFDGKKFNFMGTCKYTLAEPCPAIERGNLPAFSVAAKNFIIPNRRPGRSWTEYLDVTVFGYTFRLAQGNKIIKDGDEITDLDLPFEDVANGLTVEIGGKGKKTYTYLRTDFGLEVEWDGDMKAKINLPSTYKNKMCGLCGNYDGKAGNDVVGKVVDWANKYRITGCDDCDPACMEKDEPAEACDKPEKMALALTTCKIMNDSAIYDSCPDARKEYYDDCKYDTCALEGTEVTQVLCSGLRALADACMEEDSKFPDKWQDSIDKCRQSCGPNMIETDDAPGCPATCKYPNGRRGRRCSKKKKVPTATLR